MANFWMVRAGEGGYLAGHFERESCVAIGFEGAGDFSAVRTLDAMKERLTDANPGAHPSAIATWAAMAFKFRSVMAPGDEVVTYDPASREYSVGQVVGEYTYRPGKVPDYNHVRDVKWLGKVGRDVLTTASKNTLGSVLTLFEPGQPVLQDLKRAMAGEPAEVLASDDPAEDLDLLREDVAEKAHEFIKDKILALSADDMERLVAGLLRAMGYRARVTPKGPDRGRDIIASPDGLGLQQPRILGEVKHRQAAMGADKVRSFVGALRPADRGLYVSTGGFTREAKYEAERASVPVTLVDLDDLARLVTDHYEGFDMNARALIPLVRVYWPSS